MELLELAPNQVETLVSSQNQDLFDIEKVNHFFFKKLTYFISAEINDPLTVIDSQIQELQTLLRDRKHISPELLSTSLQRIALSNQKIDKITKHLRRLSEQSPRTTSENVFMSKILKETLEICQNRLLQHQFKVFQSVDPNLIVHVRAPEIMQILVHLIENSLKANMNKPSAWLQIESRRENNMAILCLWDSGTGIPDDKLPEALGNNSSGHKHTIRGLPVATQLALANKGSLEVSNSSGKTKFTLALPLFKS